MKVYLVEYREKEHIVSDFDCVGMHVASTKEKAIQWCKDNVDMLLIFPENLIKSWFSVHEEEVDSADIASSTLLGYFYGDSHELVDEQPI